MHLLTRFLFRGYETDVRAFVYTKYVCMCTHIYILYMFLLFDQNVIETLYKMQMVLWQGF